MANQFCDFTLDYRPGPDTRGPGVRRLLALLRAKTVSGVYVRDFESAEGLRRYVADRIAIPELTECAGDVWRLFQAWVKFRVRGGAP